MNVKNLTIVCMLFLTISGLFAQDPPSKVKVVAEQANIRIEPDIGSAIIFQAPQGSQLEAIKKEGEWYEVKFITDQGNISHGYVHESLVIEVGKPVVKEPAPPPEQEEIITEEIVEQEEVKPLPPPPPQEEKKPQVRSDRLPMSASLAIGMSYRDGGDINVGAKGLADFYADTFASKTEGSVSSVHLTFLFGGEIQIPIYPKLFVGLGFDYFRGKKESTVTYIETSPAAIYTTTPQITAIPVRLTLTYAVLPQLYFKGGVEYYFAGCNYYYRIQQDEHWEEWTGKANSHGFGLLFGIGYDHSIAPNLSIFAEATGHFAKINDFSGKNDYQDGEGFTSTEEGKLYIYQAQVGTQSSHPLVFIREKKPSEGGVSDPELATIDYSGLSLRFGLRFYF